MKMSKVEEGLRVTYQPHAEAPVEFGVVTSMNSAFVFVQFENELRSKACTAEVLSAELSGLVHE